MVVACGGVVVVVVVGVVVDAVDVVDVVDVDVDESVAAVVVVEPDVVALADVVETVVRVGEVRGVVFAPVVVVVVVVDVVLVVGGGSGHGASSCSDGGERSSDPRFKISWKTKLITTFFFPKTSVPLVCSRITDDVFRCVRAALSKR